MLCYVIMLSNAKLLSGLMLSDGKGQSAMLRHISLAICKVQTATLSLALLYDAVCW